MTGKYTPFHTADSNIYLANNLGGFSVRHCPSPEELAALIVRAVNAHDGLVAALNSAVRMLDPSNTSDELLDQIAAALAAARETAP